MSIILNAILFIMAIYDMIFARRDGGDPTMPTTVPNEGTTIGNPGFRERTNGKDYVVTTSTLRLISNHK